MEQFQNVGKNCIPILFQSYCCVKAMQKVETNGAISKLIFLADILL